MKVAIFDVKTNKCSDIEHFVNKCSISEYERIYIDKFDSVIKLLANLKSGEFYDLLFIYCRYECNNEKVIGDIIRNELDNQNINIVYISDYKIDASKLIDSRPIKLLTEPISQDNILDVFSTLRKIRGNKEYYFKVKNGKNIKFVSYRNIIYFASTARKISVITNKEKYICYGKIKDLNMISGFIKVHKSFLINLNYIKEYNYKSLKMVNNDYIPISQSLRPSIKNIIDNL